jgi:hypothetical protein
MSTPPVLFVYIIDPFEYFTFINLKLKTSASHQASQQSAKARAKTSGNKTPLNSSMNNSDVNTKSAEEGVRVKEEKMNEEGYEAGRGENSSLPNESNSEQQGEAEDNDNWEAGDALGGGSSKEHCFNESDLKRLRVLGLFKAYMEMLNNIPDLFKYSTQFQIMPLNLCMDFQQQSTSKIFL